MRILLYVFVVNLAEKSDLYFYRIDYNQLHNFLIHYQVSTCVFTIL